MQKKPFKYDVEVWYDKPNGRERIEYMGGVDTYLWRYDLDMAYEINPQKDKLVCQEYSPGDGPTLTSFAKLVEPFEGHTGEEMRYASLPLPGFNFRKNRAALKEKHAALLGEMQLGDDDEDELTNVLPDVSSWTYNGTATLNHVTAHLWTLEECMGQKVNHYKFYAKADGTPVRLELLGYNFVFGSHYDMYVFDYESYQPGAVPVDVFEAPTHCKKLPGPPLSRASASGFPTGLVRTAMSLGSLSPRPARHSGLSPDFDAHVIRHGRRFSSRLEYLLRSKVYRENHEVVRSTNADSEAPYMLELNRFSDWTEFEFRAFMLPKSLGGRETSAKTGGFLQEGANLPVYEGPKPTEGVRAALPASIDWRGTGAVAPVKDQACCGSCWAFGMTSAIESAFFMQTGKGVSLSEQQAVDCAWDTNNGGCDGGEQDSALFYFLKMSTAGGVMLEDDYPYVGQDAYCVERKTANNVRVKGYGYVRPWSVDALKSALYFKGPVTISIDANPVGLRFYSSGIYKSKECGNTLEDLDHAVTAVGYGTTDAGETFWIVKNSWSTYFGADGYILISAEDNMCGVMTQPVYAEVFVPESTAESRST